MLKRNSMTNLYHAKLNPFKEEVDEDGFRKTNYCKKTIKEMLFKDTKPEEKSNQKT